MERAKSVETGRLVNPRRGILNAQIVVRGDGRDVAVILESDESLDDDLDSEEYVERIKRRAGSRYWRSAWRWAGLDVSVGRWKVTEGE